MPPKGKKGKTGKKKSKEKGENVRPSEKEIILQTELDKKVQLLAELKLRARVAQEENNWLNEEARKIRAETGEYMQYMSKKSNRRQAQIITLNDHHRNEIEDINRDRENMMKEYEQRKQELRTQLLQKQNLLGQVKQELETMHEYEMIQQKQNDEIRRLQSEIKRLRSEHVTEISHIRLNFEKQIQKQRSDADVKIEEIRQQAAQAAEQYLYDRTLDIQDANVQLRKTLLDVLKRTQALSDLKQRLEEEQSRMIHQIKLSTDLRKIRLERISNSIKNDF